MAYKLIWSPAARDDLHDKVIFIARDNSNRAMSFGCELISEKDRLQEFPELGRVVPEYRNDNLREISFGRIGSYTAMKIRASRKIHLPIITSRFQRESCPVPLLSQGLHRELRPAQ